MTLPEKMTAIEIAAPGGPEALVPVERPVPRPGPGEVLVRVAAAGVNRPDVMQRQGNYPPPPGASDIPGLENRRRGGGGGAGGGRGADRICALVQGGGYAGNCLAAAPLCLPVPAGLGDVQAAALPETCFTVWTNVFERGRLMAGESILVHGGSSGIGTTAIQLARAFGATVYATAGSPEKCRPARAWARPSASTTGRTTSSRASPPRPRARGRRGARHGRGRLLSPVHPVSCDRGPARPDRYPARDQERDQLLAIMVKRLTVTGSTLRPRGVAEKTPIANAFGNGSGR